MMVDIIKIDLDANIKRVSRFRQQSRSSHTASARFCCLDSKTLSPFCRVRCREKGQSVQGFVVHGGRTTNGVLEPFFFEQLMEIMYDIGED